VKKENYNEYQGHAGSNSTIDGRTY